MSRTEATESSAASSDSCLNSPYTTLPRPPLVRHNHLPLTPAEAEHQRTVDNLPVLDAWILIRGLGKRYFIRAAFEDLSAKPMSYVHHEHAITIGTSKDNDLRLLNVPGICPHHLRMTPVGNFHSGDHFLDEPRCQIELLDPTARVEIWSQGRVQLLEYGFPQLLTHNTLEVFLGERCQNLGCELTLSFPGRGIFARYLLQAGKLGSGGQASVYAAEPHSAMAISTVRRTTIHQYRIVAPPGGNSTSSASSFDITGLPRPFGRTHAPVVVMKISPRRIGLNVEDMTAIQEIDILRIFRAAGGCGTIVDLLDDNRDDHNCSQLVRVIPLLPGGTLRDHINLHRDRVKKSIKQAQISGLAPEQIEDPFAVEALLLRVSKDLMDAFVFAHSLGITHNDVHASNILLTGPLQHAKFILNDFGMGVIESDKSTAGEQRKAKDFSGLGLILFEMLFDKSRDLPMARGDLPKPKFIKPTAKRLLASNNCRGKYLADLLEQMIFWNFRSSINLTDHRWFSATTEAEIVPGVDDSGVSADDPPEVDSTAESSPMEAGPSGVKRRAANTKGHKQVKKPRTE